MKTRNPARFAMRCAQPTIQAQSVHALLFVFIGIFLGIVFDLRSVFIWPKPRLADYDGIVTKQAFPQGDFTKGGFIFYFYNARMLVTIHQKTGTTSFWNWIYKGLTNQTFNCDTYVQDVASPCWRPHVRAWWVMPEEERQSVISDPDILRVAIHRDPLDRVISCWKSKYACKRNSTYKVDLRDQPRMMQEMDDVISQATNGESLRLSPELNVTNKQCLTIEEYAYMLDVVSDGIDNGRVNVFTMESHLRPQIYFYQYVNYSMVLPVHKLKNATLVKPIVDRLPFVPNGTACGHVHSTKGSDLIIPEKTALMLARYASWSERAMTKPLHWIPQVYNSINAW